MGSARPYNESTTIMSSPFQVYRPLPDSVIAVGTGK